MTVWSRIRGAGVCAVVVLSAALAGCASPGIRGELVFGMNDAPEGKRIVWPAEPEVPRYLYAGTLVGEQNFVAPKTEEAKRGLAAFGAWLVGLGGAEPRVVLQRPAAVIGDNDGRIFVSDVSRQGIFVFDQRAGELQVWEQAEGFRTFLAPSGMAVGADGSLYVADADLAFVAHLDARGETLAPIGKGLLQRPIGVALDAASGQLYVADAYAHDIKVFDPEGRLVNTIGRRGEGDGEFNFPTHLAFVRGELYVTDTMNSRIQIFGADGQLLKGQFGERGLYIGNMVRPKGVGVDSEGNIYVVESYYDSLLIYNPGGELLLQVGGTGTSTGSFYLPSGVWIDANNRVFVTDMFNGRVVLFQFLGGG